MDNLSHSVAGLAVGELVHRALREEPYIGRQRLRRRLLLASGWLASNIPDLDIILTPLLPEPLGYLLHHRGYTHTLLYILPQALLVWGGIWLFWPSARSLLRVSAMARKGFVSCLVASFAVHLLMDYLNSYGLHPFHPFESRWFYGDMVFIVEPLFWVPFGVPLILMIRRGWLKGGLLLLLAASLLFFTLKGFLAWPSLFFLGAVGAIIGMVQYKGRSNGAFILAATVSILFVGMQYMASLQADSLVRASEQGGNASAGIVDVSLTPFPSNPVCWNFISIESREREGVYLMKRGILSLAPDMQPPSSCPSGFSAPSGQHPLNRSMALLSEEKGSLERLRRLKADNCYFEAWLRFARVPSIGESEASDLRFAYGERGNFTSMDLEKLAGHSCPTHIPRWGFPRADLLMQSGARE